MRKELGVLCVSRGSQCCQTHFVETYYLTDGKCFCVVVLLYEIHFRC
jgi:hypothetical protein